MQTKGGWWFRTKTNFGSKQSELLEARMENLSCTFIVMGKLDWPVLNSLRIMLDYGHGGAGQFIW